MAGNRAVFYGGTMRRKGMKQTGLSWRMVSGVVATALALYASPVMAGNEAEVAEHLIELVKIGRGVLSEQMKNINDPAKADKGFTGEYMAGQVVERFKKSTKLDLRIPNVSPWFKRKKMWWTKLSRSSTSRVFPSRGLFPPCLPGESESSSIRSPASG
jgi:hypothetical protein